MLEFSTTGHATVTGGEYYNPNHGPATGAGDWQDWKKFRWLNGYNGSYPNSEPWNPIPAVPGDPVYSDWELNAIGIVHPSLPFVNALGRQPAFGNDGLGGGAASGDDLLAYADYFPETNTWTGSYLLGHIDVEVTSTAGPPTVNFAVSPGWITQQGDTDPWSTVAFGLNDPIDGRTDHNMDPSSYPDVTFIPEPASLVLLALGASLIRRR